MDLAGTALRCAFAYMFLLVLVRLSGKRAIRQGSAMDLVTALVLGELVDKLLTGKVQFSQYATASVAIAVLHQAVEYLVYRSSDAAGWLAGREQPLVSQARFVRRSMRSERINERAVLAALRMRGQRDLREIKASDLEISGEVSALKEDWARDAQQQDRHKIAGSGEKP
jgi:uncharacterized membrane protein YcaP (DUF421 family)